MKNIIKRSGAVALTIIMLMSSSCSQDFLDVPAEGVPTIGNYYVIGGKNGRATS